MTNREIIESAKNKKNIVIFGIGEIGKYWFQVFETVCLKKTVVICDNSHKKQSQLSEYKVIPVENAVRLFPNALYVVTSAIHETAMKGQLLSLGITEKNILLGVTEEIEDYLLKKKEQIKLQPLEKLQFEIDITAHCNLNCKSCSQFSCIADEEYINIEELERDMKRLGDIFEGEMNRMYLIGGEPLLHPRITECMYIARKYFPIGKISVFTNGILLLKCDDKFWEECKKSKISIIVTKYPIKLDYNKIINKAREKGVDFEFFGTSEDFKYMVNLGLDLEGKQEVTKSFLGCIESNNCIKLKNGRLFTCTRPAAIYRFNKFFEKNMEVSEKDYVDIYEVKSKEEILKKMAEPIPFCRYCNIFGKRRAMDWGETEKNIEEWLC